MARCLDVTKPFAGAGPSHRWALMPVPPFFNPTCGIRWRTSSAANAVCSWCWSSNCLFVLRRMARESNKDAKACVEVFCFLLEHLAWHVTQWSWSEGYVASCGKCDST